MPSAALRPNQGKGTELKRTKDSLADVDDFLGRMSEYDGKIRTLIYGIVHERDVIEDLLQDTYLRAFRSLSSFRADSSFKTWVYRIATNVSLDHTRRRKAVVATD